MTTFKELESHIKLYVTLPNRAIDTLTELTKILYGQNTEKYKNSLKILVDIQNDVNEHTASDKLKTKIASFLTEDLYLKNPERYIKNVMELEYFVWQHNDYNFGIDIIGNVLARIGYKDINILKKCSQHYTTKQLCEAVLTPDQKYQMLIHMYTDAVPWGMPFLIKEIADVPLENLGIMYQLKLIHNLVIPAFIGANSIPIKQKSYVNKIIDKVSITTEIESELIKFLVLPKILNKQNFSKITSLYPDGKFKSLLKIAQALGLEHNSNYWIQSLPSLQKTCQTHTDTPIFD